MKARRGIYAAAISPFGPTGSLDAAKLVDYCRYLVSEGGCDGVAPTGTTGEGNSISLVDRMALPSAFAAAGFDSDQVIFGTGSCAVQDAVMLSRAALDAGFPNVLVLPPFYYKGVSDDGIYDGFARLIERVGRDDLRVYLYHFPQMSQTPLAPAMVKRLKTSFGDVVAGLKDSSGDFSQSKAFVDATGGVAEDFDVYPSSEAMVFDGEDAGCAGIISGSTNAFAATVQAARRASGAARVAALDAVKARRALAGKYPIIPMMKQMEAWRSGDPSWLEMAPPLRPLSAEQAEALKADLDALTPVAEAAE